jgi:hypothetical protein
MASLKYTKEGILLKYFFYMVNYPCENLVCEKIKIYFENFNEIKKCGM